MMGFTDFKEFAEAPLVLPINGKRYTVPEVGAQAGLTLTGVLDGDGSKATDMSTDELGRLVLGSAYQQMVDDDVPASALNRAVATGTADFQFGREAAEGVWESNGDPELLAAWVAARSRKSGSASTTRRRASGTSTSTSTKRPAKKSTRR